MGYRIEYRKKDSQKGRAPFLLGLIVFAAVILMGKGNAEFFRRLDSVVSVLKNKIPVFDAVSAFWAG